MKLKRAARAAAIVAVAIALGLWLRHWAVGAVRVEGASMQDTLQSGDIALVTHFDYADGRTPARGDVVQCRFPGRGGTYIKRVVGLPGEKISFSGGGLLVDGEAVAEEYVSSATEDFEIALGPDEYLALGDNRAESYDSRMPDMGAIGAADCLGRVRFILWPVGRIGPVS